jgi:hypothetical protein
MQRVSALIVGCCVAACSSDGEECDVSGFMGEAGEIAFQPRPGISWQWQLSDLPVDTSICAAVYDVDLFTTSEQEIDALREGERAVICYFSAGSFESGRPDSDSFPAEVKGDPLEPPFEDELWVDIRSPAVLEIMEARLDKAVFHAEYVESVGPDDLDDVCNLTRQLGLSTIMKNIDLDAYRLACPEL